LHGDFTTISENQYGSIDLLVGGTPCQSFSIAGLRKGLDDDRGNLSLEFIKLAQRERPRWLVWENVPGVLSSNGGKDFGSFLGALGEIGYGFAYRVLDAQYFGVAQRRRRVFVVGYLGDWRRAAAVLFERESLRGNPAPSRKKGEVTPTITKEGTGVSRTGHNEDGRYIPEVSATLTRGCAQRFDYESETMLPVALAENTIGRQPQNGGNGDGFTVGGPMYTLNATGVHGVAHTVGSLCARTGLSVSSQDAANGHLIAHQPIPLDLRNAGRDPEKHDEINRQGVGVGQAGDPSHTVTTACVHGVAQQCDTLYEQGLTQWNNYASAQETNSGKILSTLRDAIGEEAFTQWGLGILNSLQSPEVLRQALHGKGIRPAAFSRSWVVYCTLSRSENDSGWLLQSLRETECEGCPPQGWQPPEQLVGELRTYLSQLSQPGAQSERLMRDLWFASEGLGILRETLSEVQKMGRSFGSENQSTHLIMQVRRLTPEEAEFLQGFPRGYSDIQPNGKQTPDGPRYKALGNSMAVPVMKWIGERINKL